MSTPVKDYTKTMFRRWLNDRYGMNYLPFIELKPHMKKRPYGDYLYANDKGRFDMYFCQTYRDIMHKDWVDMSGKKKA